jgi:hypothetical protein
MIKFRTLFLIEAYKKPAKLVFAEMLSRLSQMAMKIS